MIMIGKGNRSKAVTKACKNHGGFYLGSIGGVAATLSQGSIESVSVLDMEEQGMEAVWKIVVKDFPAFIVIDDKGDDFFKQWSGDYPAIEIEMDSSFDEIRDTFFGLDKDQSGGLNLSELASGLGLSIEEAAKILTTYDVDRSGSLSLVEFERLVAARKDLLAELWHRGENETDCDVRDMFSGWDKDRSGGLNLNELATGLGLSAKEASRILMTYNVNQSGSLSLPEFQSLVQARRDLFSKSD